MDNTTITFDTIKWYLVVSHNFPSFFAMKVFIEPILRSNVIFIHFLHNYTSLFFMNSLLKYLDYEILSFCGQTWYLK